MWEEHGNEDASPLPVSRAVILSKKTHTDVAEDLDLYFHMEDTPELYQNAAVRIAMRNRMRVKIPRVESIAELHPLPPPKVGRPRNSRGRMTTIREPATNDWPSLEMQVLVGEKTSRFLARKIQERERRRMMEKWKIAFDSIKREKMGMRVRLRRERGSQSETTEEGRLIYYHSFKDENDKKISVWREERMNK